MPQGSRTQTTPDAWVHQNLGSHARNTGYMPRCPEQWEGMKGPYSNMFVIQFASTQLVRRGFGIEHQHALVLALWMYLATGMVPPPWEQRGRGRAAPMSSAAGSDSSAADGGVMSGGGNDLACVEMWVELLQRSVDNEVQSAEEDEDDEVQPMEDEDDDAILYDEQVGGQRFWFGRTDDNTPFDLNAQMIVVLNHAKEVGKHIKEIRNLLEQPVSGESYYLHGIYYFLIWHYLRGNVEQGYDMEQRMMYMTHRARGKRFYPNKRYTLCLGGNGDTSGEEVLLDANEVFSAAELVHDPQVDKKQRDAAQYLTSQNQGTSSGAVLMHGRDCSGIKDNMQRLFPAVLRQRFLQPDSEQMEAWGLGNGDEKCVRRLGAVHDSSDTLLVQSDLHGIWKRFKEVQQQYADVALNREESALLKVKHEEAVAALLPKVVAGSRHTFHMYTISTPDTPVVKLSEVADRDPEEKYTLLRTSFGHCCIKNVVVVSGATVLALFEEFSVAEIDAHFTGERAEMRVSLERLYDTTTQAVDAYMDAMFDDRTWCRLHRLHAKWKLTKGVYLNSKRQVVSNDAERDLFVGTFEQGARDLSVGPYGQFVAELGGWARRHGMRHSFGLLISIVTTLANCGNCWRGLFSNWLLAGEPGVGKSYLLGVVTLLAGGETTTLDTTAAAMKSRDACKVYHAQVGITHELPKGLTSEGHGNQCEELHLDMQKALTGEELERHRSEEDEDGKRKIRVVRHFLQLRSIAAINPHRLDFLPAAIKDRMQIVHPDTNPEHGVMLHTSSCEAQTDPVFKQWQERLIATWSVMMPMLNEYATLGAPVRGTGAPSTSPGDDFVQSRELEGMPFAYDLLQRVCDALQERFNVNVRVTPRNKEVYKNVLQGIWAIGVMQFSQGPEARAIYEARRSAQQGKPSQPVSLAKELREVVARYRCYKATTAMCLAAVSHVLLPMMSSGNAKAAHDPSQAIQSQLPGILPFMKNSPVLIAATRARQYLAGTSLQEKGSVQLCLPDGRPISRCVCAAADEPRATYTLMYASPSCPQSAEGDICCVSTLPSRHVWLHGFVHGLFDSMVNCGTCKKACTKPPRTLFQNGRWEEDYSGGKCQCEKATDPVPLEIPDTKKLSEDFQLLLAQLKQPGEEIVVAARASFLAGSLGFGPLAAYGSQIIFICLVKEAGVQAAPTPPPLLKKLLSQGHSERAKVLLSHVPAPFRDGLSDKGAKHLCEQLSYRQDKKAPVNPEWTLFASGTLRDLAMRLCAQQQGRGKTCSENAVMHSFTELLKQTYEPIGPVVGSQMCKDPSRNIAHCEIAGLSLCMRSAATLNLEGIAQHSDCDVEDPLGSCVVHDSSTGAMYTVEPGADPSDDPGVVFSLLGPSPTAVVCFPNHDNDPDYPLDRAADRPVLSVTPVTTTPSTARNDPDSVYVTVRNPKDDSVSTHRLSDMKVGWKVPVMEVDPRTGQPTKVVRTTIMGNPVETVKEVYGVLRWDVNFKYRNVTLPELQQAVSDFRAASGAPAPELSKITGQPQGAHDAWVRTREGTRIPAWMMKGCLKFEFMAPQSYPVVALFNDDRHTPWNPRDPATGSCKPYIHTQLLYRMMAQLDEQGDGGEVNKQRQCYDAMQAALDQCEEELVIEREHLPENVQEELFPHELTPGCSVNTTAMLFVSSKTDKRFHGAVFPIETIREAANPGGRVLTAHLVDRRCTCECRPKEFVVDDDDWHGEGVVWVDETHLFVPDPDCKLGHGGPHVLSPGDAMYMTNRTYPIKWNPLAHSVQIRSNDKGVPTAYDITGVSIHPGTVFPEGMPSDPQQRMILYHSGRAAQTPRIQPIGGNGVYMDETGVMHPTTEVVWPSKDEDLMWRRKLENELHVHKSVLPLDDAEVEADNRTRRGQAERELAALYNEDPQLAKRAFTHDLGTSGGGSHTSGKQHVQILEGIQGAHSASAAAAARPRDPRDKERVDNKRQKRTENLYRRRS